MLSPEEKEKGRAGEREEGESSFVFISLYLLISALHSDSFGAKKNPY